VTHTIDSLLNELRRDWIVAINSTRDGWLVSITREVTSSSHYYMGPDLAHLIYRAWAGDPDDHRKPSCMAQRVR
jgi:hypothetical protein